MMPVVHLPGTGLPIEDVIEAVRVALTRTGTAVLQAEPGAGKTTVVPLRLLAEPWLAGRRIVMLEPRRVAARAAARRMALLIGESPGDTVGWVTRDDRRVSPSTRIEVVTEGVLTARLIDDPGLSGIGLVIFDEFHERSLPGDTGLALACYARCRGQLDARLLVMSATLDTDTVARFISVSEDPAPVINAPGRTHPVEIRWRPRRHRDPLVPKVVRAIDEAFAASGSVLVFLPGVGEIHRVEQALRGAFGTGGPVVMALHGSLPAAEQDAAIVARAERRIVLATDIAETSLTVEGIGSVVDAGLNRVPRYDPRTAMTTLVTTSASRSSAEQRAGRAGRTGPGVAIRLWSKIEHASRRRYLPPEITQVDLAGLVLDLARRGIVDRLTVPFIDPPPEKVWREAATLLRSLGAIDTDGSATPMGMRMARVPAHPRLAHMIVASAHPWLACLLTALLDERDILRGRPGSLPADLGERVALLIDPARQHPAADGRATRAVRRRADDLARRLGVDEDSVDLADIGAVLATGFPDRVARSRPREKGRFVMISGRTLKVARGDGLESAAGLVAVDLGGRTKDPVVHRGARLEAHIDHIVYATPDLDATVAEVTEEWGVEPSVGGCHDGLGTRNALLSLGGGIYLELVGPDPGQTDPPGPRPFGVDDLEAPRVVTWAARVPNIDLWVAWARARGFDPGDPVDMQRTTPSGEVLSWRLTFPLPGDGVVPFLIEWPGPTPASTAAGGITLMALDLRHDDPAVGVRIAEHALPISVARGFASITATLVTPKGVVSIGS